MENQGWIKLHRKILENPKINTDNDYFVVWIKLLFFVTHKEKDVIFKGKRITIKPGQLLTGRTWMAKKCNVNRSKLERILKWFESEHQIEQQTSNQNRLITVKNWEKYQTSEQRSEQQVSNKRATSEHIQECKNDKNDNTNVLSQTVPKQFGNKTINLMIDILKEFNDVSSLDESERVNRRYASLLIKNKITPEFKKRTGENPNDDEMLHSFMAILRNAEDFHKKNVTNFKYIYYNFGKLIKQNSKSINIV